MNTIETEAAEIQGGPLDGIRLSVVKGKPTFRIGKQIEHDAELCFADGDSGAVWNAGHLNTDEYIRTNRRTAGGRVIYAPAETVPA